MYRYSRRELYNIIADTSSYPRFVPFCSSTRILRTSPPTSSLSSHISKPSAELLSSKEVLELDVEMTVKFLVHEESYVSLVTCRPFDSVTVRYAFSVPIFRRVC